VFLASELPTAQSAGTTDGPILVVDDDRTFCATLAAALRRRGFAAVVAHGFDEAVAESAAWHPSRAVVDLRMPGRGGLALVGALTRDYADLRIVVLTGYGSIATAVEAIKLGAVHYLTKPADVAEILAAFQREQPVLDAQPAEVPMSLDDLAWEHLQQVLADAGGNISEAARRLGMHRRTLQRKLAKRR
jgi:two-component system, response regulator RegA